MKEKYKHVIGCIATLILTILLIGKVGSIVAPNTYEARDAIHTFHDVPENSLDVIAYGSSHVLRGLDPNVMYRNYGIGAYNYSYHWQKMNTILLFLKDSFRTQSPKIALIDTFTVDSLKENTDVDGEIYYTKEISWFDGKQDYLKQCFGSQWDRYLAYYVPMYAFHDNWISINNYSFSKPHFSPFFWNTKGFTPSEAITEVTIPDPTSFQQSELSQKNLDILTEIVNTCNEHGTKVIFYTAPWAGEYHFSDALTKFAAENNCDYLNLFDVLDEMGIDGNCDFSDEGHLNASGAAKVADYLGAYISEHYDLQDMRLVENNLWETNFCPSHQS